MIVIDPIARTMHFGPIDLHDRVQVDRTLKAIADAAEIFWPSQSDELELEYTVDEQPDLPAPPRHYAAKKALVPERTPEELAAMRKLMSPDQISRLSEAAKRRMGVA